MKLQICPDVFIDLIEVIQILYRRYSSFFVDWNYLFSKITIFAASNTLFNPYKP